MTGSIDKDFLHPILVDEEFLRQVERRMVESITILTKELADRFEVDETALRQMIEGEQQDIDKDKQPSNVIRAVEAFSIEYTVHWRNDISAKVTGIENLIEALTLEHAVPRQVVAEVGRYPTAFISLQIKEMGGYTANLRVRAPLKKVRELARPIESLIKNNQPDHAYLHHAFFKVFLVSVAFLSAMALMVFAISSISTTVPGVAGLGLSMLGAAAGFGAAAMGASWYKLTFPGVVFDFGSGKKHGDRKKVFFALLTVIFSIALALAFA